MASLRKWNKLQRFLGGDNEDTLNRLLTTGNLVVQPAEFSTVWASMGDPDHATKAMALMIQRLLDIERERPKVEKALRKAGSPVGVDALAQHVMNTMRFLDIFYEIEPSTTEFTRAVQAWEAHRKQNPAGRWEADDVVSTIQRRHVQQDDLLVTMVIDCSTLGFMEAAAGMLPMHQGDAASDAAPPAPPAAFEAAAVGLEEYPEEFPFVALHLQACLGGEAESRPTRLFEQLLVLLHKMPSALRSMPHFTQLRVLALLHMLHSYLSLCPTPDTAWLLRARDVVKTFHHWPRPYGHVARQLLALLNTEMRSPGAALRHVVLSENPHLAAPAAAPGLHGERVVTVVADADSPRSALLAHVFRAAVEAPADERQPAPGSADEAMALRARLLEHMLATEFALPAGVLSLSARSPEDIARWFSEALDALWSAEQVPLEGGANKRFREERLGAVLAQIAGGANGGGGDGDGDHGFAPRRAEDCGLPPAGDVRGFAACPVAPPALDLRFCMADMPGTKAAIEEAFASCAAPEAQLRAARPPARSRATRMPSSLATLRRDASFRKASSMTHVRRPSLRPSLMGGAGGAAPGSPVVGSPRLTALPAQRAPPGSPGRGPAAADADADDLALPEPAQPAADDQATDEPTHAPLQRRASASAPVESLAARPSSTPEMRVCVLGGNEAVHRTVCALVALHEAHPRMAMAAAAPALFVVPEGRNDLARYLAERDLWYRRQVYSPFVGALRLLPQYPVHQDVEPALLDEAMLAHAQPVMLQRALLQDYARSARHNVRLSVFECEAFTELPPSQDAEPDYVVPFVMRLELGLLCSRARYRQARAQPAASLVDALADREWAEPGVTPELTVLYSGITMDGRFTEPVERTGTAYATVSVTNLPASCGDTELGETRSQISEHNSPSAPLLAMHTRPAASAAGVRDHYRKRREAEAAVEALRQPDAEDVPVHIGALDIQVSDPDHEFYVLLDGCPYGPVKCVRVQPSAAVPEGLDLRTFFPLDS